MGFLNLPVIGDIVGMVGDSFRGRRERRKARLDAELKALEKRVDQEISWEQLQAQNAASSWKDEYWTIVLSIPLIMCFFPSLVPHIKAGFEALETMPVWYRASLGVAIAAAFGIKSLVTLMGMKK